jgi:anti-sigma factor RsiW
VNCRFISSRLSAFVDRELEMWEYVRIESHLAKCARCREELEAIRLIKQRVASLPERTPPADLQERLWDLCRRLEREEGALLPWRSRLFRVPPARLTVLGAAVVASVAVAAAVLLFQFQNSPSQTAGLEAAKELPGITEADQALDQRRNPLSGIPVGYSPEFAGR